MRPDHGAIMQRYRREIDALDGGRPVHKRLYELRKLLKGWCVERDAYQVQLDEIVANGRSWQPVKKNSPPAAGYTDASYARARLAELAEKITLLTTAVDLRTDEEIRGTHRAEYTRDELTQDKIDEGFGRMTNAEYAVLREKIRAMVRRQAREKAEFERKAKIPGSPERRERYLYLRYCLTLHEETIEHVQRVHAKRTLDARRAKHHGLPTPTPASIDADEALYIERLAKLDELNTAYADVADIADINEFVHPLSGGWDNEGTIGGQFIKPKRSRKKSKPNLNPPEGTRS